MASPFERAMQLEGLTGVPGALARSIYQQESNSGSNAYDSNAGAVGGMQVMPATFNSVADPGWDIRDPEANARAGLRYLKQGWDASGNDPKLAAAYYYGGPGGMSKAAQGVAVSDPRNPKAPNTLQYAEQVVNRMATPTNMPQQFDDMSTDGEGTSGAQLIGALGSPAANAALSQTDQAQGALSAAPTNLGYDSGPVAPTVGALSSMPQQRQPFDLQKMIEQFVPKDDSASKYLAIASALGKPTGFGTIGETFSNISEALLAQKANQDKLRSQYVPLIMQQVAAQQARDENHQFMAQQAAIAAQQHQQNMQMQIGAQAQNSQLARENTLAIATANQGLRQDANNNANATSRAHLFSSISAARPFDTPEQVWGRVNAMMPQSGSGQQGNGAPVQPSTMPPSLLGPGSATEGLTGDTFLASLPAPLATTVKKVVAGEIAIPGGMAAKSPYWQSVLQAAGQYDDTFDQTDYNKRLRTAQSFTSGKQGDALKSANQAIAHAGSLYDVVDQMNNQGGFAHTPINAVVNAYQEHNTDSTLQGTFRGKVEAVATELRKVFGGVGGGSLQELNAWKDSIPMNASKAQQKAYIQSGMELLNGSIDALNNQYQSGMGRNADLMRRGLITPKSQATLAKIRGEAPPLVSPAVDPNAGWDEPTAAPVANDLVNKWKSK